jgi:hypothetical protein
VAAERSGSSVATTEVIERATRQSPAIIGRGLRLPDVARPRLGSMAAGAVEFIGRLLKVAPSTNHGNRYKLNL